LKGAKLFKSVFIRINFQMGSIESGNYDEWFHPKDGKMYY